MLNRKENKHHSPPSSQSIPLKRLSMKQREAVLSALCCKAANQKTTNCESHSVISTRHNPMLRVLRVFAFEFLRVLLQGFATLRYRTPRFARHTVMKQRTIFDYDFRLYCWRLSVCPKSIPTFDIHQSSYYTYTFDGGFRNQVFSTFSFPSSPAPTTGNCAFRSI